MRALKTGVANVIDVGPAVIGTTGGTLVSPSTGLTNATVDEVGVYKHGATALTSTTGSALTHRSGGMYTLSLSTAHVDTIGRLSFYLRDDSACLPVRHEFMVLSAEAYEAQYEANGWPANFGALVLSTGGDITADITGNLSGSVGSVTAGVGVDSIGGSTIPPQFMSDYYGSLHKGQVAAGAAGSVTLSTSAVRSANFYRGSWAYIYSGVGAGQSPRYITAGTTALLQTISPNWVTTPTTASNVMVLTIAPGVTASTSLPRVDVRALGGSSQSLLDLKDFADAGYNPATNALTTPTNFAVLSISTAGAVTSASTATYPTNFVNMAITTGGIVTANTTQVEGVDATNQLAAAVNSSTLLAAMAGASFATATDSLEAIRNRGDAAWTGGSTAVNPTNFDKLSISTAGVITLVDVTQIEGLDATNQLVAAVNASTLLAAIPTTPFLAASAPANIGALSITTGGAVTAGTVSDKTGYSLSATGLNAIVPADPTGPPVWGTATVVQHLAWRSAFDINEVVETPSLMTVKGSTGDTIGTATVTASTASVTRGTFST